MALQNFFMQKVFSKPHNFRGIAGNSNAENNCNSKRKLGKFIMKIVKMCISNYSDMSIIF